MAENQEQKGNIKSLITRIFNKSALALNLLLLAFVAYQAYDFFSVYKKKHDEIFNQGRLISVGVRDGKLELNDLSDKEIDQKRLEYRKQNTPMAELKEGEIIGPLPSADLKKADEGLVGPMPAEKKTGEAAEEKKPEEVKEKKKAVIDPGKYKVANLSIIVTEIGPRKDQLDNARDLPKEVSFAFSPYSDELQKKVDFAIRDGRETLLNLMFNPSTYPVKDAGPMGILANYDESQNLAHFGATANLAKNYKGFLAIYDETITSKFDKVSPILKKVAERNAFFGFFKTNTNANLENDAKPFATDTFSVDYLVDVDPDEESIKAKLNTIKEDLLIKKKRLVIAITPDPISVQLMNDWINENVGDKINIAPISYFVTNN